jgi:transglutaminase-like putative cysteine protease
MKNKFLFVIMLLTASVNVSAQNYSIDNISEELKKNSNAVVRYTYTEFVYNDMKSATEKNIYVITVLNKQGDDLSDFVCYGDKFRTLKSFSGEIYDKDGKSVRKIKRSEIKETEYSEGLASDNKYYFLSPQTSYYPYTIKYEYEISWKNGILAFPPFSPISDYNVSLEKAEYKLTLPRSCEYLSKNLNTDIQPVVTNSATFNIYEWTLNNFAAIKSESFSPSRRQIFPLIYLTPSNFYYDNTTGNQNGWENYGKWQWSLLQGRDLLPAELKQEIFETTKGLTAREKVKTLYDYLGKHTRYVSIQLGIGGMQPMTAEEVYKSKFGDCKALSNFMKAMLQECGIESYYTEISTKNKQIYQDYACASQTNHVILQVSLDNEILWLECTNPDIPFGYVHKDIAGHNALVYKNGTAHFVTLPENSDSLNLMKQNVTVDIKSEGSASVHVSKHCKLEQYERIAGITKIEEKDKINRLQNTIDLPLSTITNLQISEDKSSLPVVNIDFDIDVYKYGSLSGSRFFVPVNPFNKNSLKLDKERNLDISIQRGYCDIDTIIVNFPSDMTVEAMPKPVSLKSDFGEFSFNMKHEKGKLEIVQTFLLRKGNYPKEKYEELSAFMKNISQVENSKIVLKKQ